MAFNLAQFNINPFNVAAGDVRYISAIGQEYISSAIGSAMYIFANAYGNECVSVEIDGASGRFIEVSGTETVSEAVTKGQLTILIYPEFQENVYASSDIAAIITPDAVGEEVVESDIVQNARAYLIAPMLEEVTADTALGAYITPTAEGYELVAESASLVVLDTKTCMLTVTLAPGQQIIIDADSYTVLLDGENAIQLQSGDWIDELDRSTTNIDIKASSGVENLTGKIIYTERYL